MTILIIRGAAGLQSTNHIITPTPLTNRQSKYSFQTGTQIQDLRSIAPKTEEASLCSIACSMYNKTALQGYLHHPELLPCFAQLMNQARPCHLVNIHFSCMETEQIVKRPEETTTEHRLQYAHSYYEGIFVEVQYGCVTRTIDVGASRVQLLC